MELPVMPPAVPTEDPYLDQLAQVATEAPDQSDPIAEFLEPEETDEDSKGWFGRRK